MECLIGGLQFVKQFPKCGASFHIGGPVSTGTAKNKAGNMESGRDSVGYRSHDVEYRIQRLPTHAALQVGKTESNVRRTKLADFSYLLYCKPTTDAHVGTRTSDPKS